MLKVGELDKPANVPCKHLCAHGCGVFDNRPTPTCGAFTCDWREGFLPKSAIPSKTHMVVWKTHLPTQDGERVEILECNIAEGEPIHQATFDHLMKCSENITVMFVRGEETWAYARGRKLAAWSPGARLSMRLDRRGIVEQVNTGS